VRLSCVGRHTNLVLADINLFGGNDSRSAHERCAAIDRGFWRNHRIMKDLPSIQKDFKHLTCDRHSCGIYRRPIYPEKGKTFEGLAVVMAGLFVFHCVLVESWFPINKKL
jgi:hypothetical protein